jgi:glutaredoxin
VTIFSKTTCPFCAKVKELFKSLNEPFTVVELDQIDEGASIRDYLFEKTGQKTVPNVYVAGAHLGGCDNTLNAHAEGRLAKLLGPEVAADGDKEPEETYDYDLIVIGGGSGGLACSKVNFFLLLLLLFFLLIFQNTQHFWSSFMAI